MPVPVQRIFVTGASGYIGGAIAATLVRAGHRVRGLVRDPRKAHAVATFGITPVLGTLDNAPLLAAEASAADATINAADSDHAGAVETLLAACAGRRLLHTSGISLLSDNARGEHGDTIHDETTQSPTHPDKAARAAIDAAILAAAAGGEAFAVIRNPLIYGDAIGPPAASVQLPTLAETARRLGRPRHVGPGLNIWSHAALSDIATFYRLLLARPETGLFYAESGEADFATLTAAIATALGQPPPLPWSLAQASEEWGDQRARHTYGSNCRVRARRARALGWQPKGESPEAWIARAIK
jgi:nucleoside-diphosphate-sugar epimerase